MKTPKLSIIAYIIGCLLIIWAFYHYLLVGGEYYETAQLFKAGVVISVGIGSLAGGYLYKWMRDKDEELKNLDKNIQSIIKMYTQEELK